MPDPKTNWTWAWLAWGLFLAGTFAVIEWLSIKSRNGKKRLDTLTSHVQWLTAAKRGPRWRKALSIAAFVGACTWAGFHFWA